MRKLLISFVGAMAVLIPVTLFAAVAQVAKTGQTTCYDIIGRTISCDGTGQDGELQRGVAWPNPRFHDNNDGTVSDFLTGLVWSKNANAPGAGSPDACGGGVAKTWAGALTYVACLNGNTFLGYNDWRLPNRKEVLSLVNYGQADPAAWLASQGFTDIQADYYWSSSTVQAHSTLAWMINMMAPEFFGYTIQGDKTSPAVVWPVRSGQFGTAVATVAPGVKDFGKVKVSTDPMGALVTLTNTAAPGNSKLNVYDIGFSGDSGLFTVLPGVNNPCASNSTMLAPGASCTMQVSFIPLKEPVSGRAATLRFTTSDSTTPDFDLNLTGTPSYQLDTSLAGQGIGTITSTPAGISCPNGNCSSLFAAGSTADLLAVPNVGSWWFAWTQFGCNGSACSVTMDQDQQVTATFNLHYLKLDGTNPTYYDIFQDAYTQAQATNGGTIRARAVSLTQDFLLIHSVPILLKGGLDNAFTNPVDYTTLKGTVWLQFGTLTVENLIISN